MPYLYDNGLPFSTGLDINIQALKERVAQNKASLLILDGAQGEGKTTLMVHVLDRINALYGKPPISLAKDNHPQLACGGKEFIKNLRLCKENDYNILGYDEAGDFNRRSAMSNFNQLLNNTFRTFRGFKIILVLALPNFNILDSWLFDNGIPRGLLHLYGRNQSYGNFKGYSLYSMNWIRHYFDKLNKGTRHFCYNNVEANFMGHFLDLPPKRAKLLDIISTASKTQTLLDTELSLEGLITVNDLLKKFNRGRTWLYDTLEVLNIKPKRRIGNKLYYEKECIERIDMYIREREYSRAPTKKPLR